MLNPLQYAVFAAVDTPACGTSCSSSSCVFVQSFLDAGTALSDWFQVQQGRLVVFAVSVLLTFIAAFLINWLLKQFFLRFAEKSGAPLAWDSWRKLHTPVFCILIASGLIGAISALSIPAALYLVLCKIYSAAVTVSVVVGLLRLIEVISTHYTNKSEAGGKSFDKLLVDLLRRTAKVALWVIAVLFIAQNVFNLNIGALLAGAGVVGLAIAFAAQNTIANIFGAIMLILDRPFSVGEVITFSGKTGIIEGIGLRSTKVRSLNGTLWQVPNSELANTTIENISMRPNIKYVFEVGLVYSTTAAQMEQARKILAEILASVPGQDLEHCPPQVFFTEMKDWSLNLSCFIWLPTKDFFSSLKLKQDLNFQILTKFNEAGLEFAYPSNTTYLAGDSLRPLLVTNKD